MRKRRKKRIDVTTIIGLILFVVFILDCTVFKCYLLKKTAFWFSDKFTKAVEAILGSYK